MQFSLTISDCMQDAIIAYHPTKLHDSYISQKDAAEPYIETFMKERVPKYLAHLENCLKANKKSSEWVVSEKMTYADVMLYQFVRGYRSSQKAHYEENADIPLIKAHTSRMEAVPSVKAFMESDRRTKMEEGTPLAEEPDVGTNSFM